MTRLLFDLEQRLTIMMQFHTAFARCKQVENNLSLQIDGSSTFPRTAQKSLFQEEKGDDDVPLKRRLES